MTKTSEEIAMTEPSKEAQALSQWLYDLWAQSNSSESRTVKDGARRIDAFARQQVEAAVAAERERCGWRIIDTAPQDGTAILLAWAGRGIVAVGYYGACGEADRGWYAWMDTVGFMNVARMTHWMPMPEPPQGEQP